ncbi:MAG: hypothetical protein OXU69_06450 [Gemmatimonadota bacterium]|nr:hypothetical protein [Gemmatimonadota bacterium]MDE2984327.1 hypothetical protein [Gemmatimonadota bacterium]
MVHQSLRWGPGEFSESIFSVLAINGRIVVNDFHKRAFAVFSAAGEYVDLRPYGFAPGPFVHIGGGQVVIFSMDRQRDLAGYPLHLVDIESGVASLHFGSEDPNNWSAAEFGGDVLTGSVVGSPGTVWWGRRSEPTIEEWSVNNELLRRIEGELPWFPKPSETEGRSGKPAPRLRGLALDSQDHLWMLTHVADRNWREVKRIEGGVLPSDLYDFSDARLDVFDLREQRHVGRYIWDSVSVRLLEYEGKPAVSVVEETEAMVPQVVVYQVGWE